MTTNTTEHSDFLTGVFGRPPAREACKFPERAPDDETEFFFGCKGCELALKAAVTVEPAPGDFDGWWRSRDEIIAEAAAKGIDLT